MTRPTREDAQLLFRILDHIGSPRFQEARSWFLSEYSAASYAEFVRKYPEGSPGYSNVTYLIGFYEFLGSLMSFGLLNEDLFFDVGSWSRPVLEDYCSGNSRLAESRVT
jgi:hypothetical protein